MPPGRMETRDFKPVEHARERMENKIRNNQVQGRMGKIQDIRQMENAGPPGRTPGDHPREGRSSPGRRPQDGAQKRPESRPAPKAGPRHNRS